MDPRRWRAGQQSTASRRWTKERMEMAEDKKLGLALNRMPIRSILAGSAGTLALTLAYATERRVRRGHRGQLDYDDSLVPGQIVASVMHLPHVTGREENELGLALRWGYGSVFGLWHGILHGR